MVSEAERQGETGGPYSVLLVGATASHAGKSAIAAALAVTLAYEGRRVLVLRLAGQDSDAEDAAADAAFFATLPFARGRGGSPVAPNEAATAAHEQRGAGGLLVLEAPAGADLSALAAELDAGVILVVRGAQRDMTSVAAARSALDGRLLGVVAVAVAAGLTASTSQALTAAPLLGVVPEDATLYAPNVVEIADALKAEIILGEPTEEDIVEHLMVGSITTDPGQPYYARPRNRRAVITRSDKTDLQLAAMHTDIDCLILTGGVEPSPYTIDRAADNEITVLLTQTDTRGAVKLLENIFVSTRFAGEPKLERMRELLGSALDWDALKHRLA